MVWKRDVYFFASIWFPYVFFSLSLSSPPLFFHKGLSEESAIHKFGADNIEVYHMQASPYEQVIVHEREELRSFSSYLTGMFFFLSLLVLTAFEVFGSESVRLYILPFLTYRFPAFMKMIVVPAENERVVGFHYCGPAAGELTQGFAVAMKMGATKKGESLYEYELTNLVVYGNEFDFSLFLSYLFFLQSLNRFRFYRRNPSHYG